MITKKSLWYAGAINTKSYRTGRNRTKGALDNVMAGIAQSINDNEFAVDQGLITRAPEKIIDASSDWEAVTYPMTSDSSMLEALFYNKEVEMLLAVFKKSRSVYLYDGVPYTTFTRIVGKTMDAESHGDSSAGATFHHLIKKAGYEYVEVDPSYLPDKINNLYY